MKIDLEKLKNNSAPQAALDWLESLNTLELEEIIKLLIEQYEVKNLTDTLTYLMNPKQSLEWAIYSVESVLPIYEGEYPEDVRLRGPIEAVKKVLKEPTKSNGDAAYDAFKYAAHVMDEVYYATDDAYYYVADAVYYAALYAYCLYAYCASKEASATYYASKAVFSACHAATDNQELKGKILWKGYEILTGGEK